MAWCSMSPSFFLLPESSRSPFATSVLLLLSCTRVFEISTLARVAMAYSMRFRHPGECGCTLMPRKVEEQPGHRSVYPKLSKSALSKCAGRMRCASLFLTSCFSSSSRRTAANRHPPWCRTCPGSKEPPRPTSRLPTTSAFPELSWPYGFTSSLPNRCRLRSTPCSSPSPPPEQPIAPPGKDLLHILTDVELPKHLLPELEAPDSGAPSLHPVVRRVAVRCNLHAVYQRSRTTMRGPGA